MPHPDPSHFCDLYTMADGNSGSLTHWVRPVWTCNLMVPSQNNFHCATVGTPIYSFWCWAACVVCILWRVIPCWSHCSQRLVPILWVVFLFYLQVHLLCKRFFISMRFHFFLFLYFRDCRRRIIKDTAMIYVEECSAYVFL